jgi:protein-disulfide isomerase
MTGPLNAPVQLVIFSDFQCPACRYFSHVTAELVEKFEGNLQVIFKHFPLGMACDPLMNTELHPRACEVAWAAEAARKQGKFWEYHDALFASELDSGHTTVSSIAKDLGLNFPQFESERRSEATKMKIQSNIELALRLGVDATPAIFLNGRRASDIRPLSLQFLVAHLLQLLS